MNRRLFHLLLIIHFGGGARHPLRSAIARLIAASAAALSVGGALGNMVWKAVLPHDLPVAWVSLLAASAVAMLVALLLLSLDSVNGWGVHQIGLGRLAAVWPLAHRQRWAVFILPQVVVSAIVACFMLPITISAAHAFHVPIMLLVLALCGGVGAGVGFGLARISHLAAVNVLIFAGIAITVIKLLVLSLQFAAQHSTYIPMALGGMALLMMYGGFWRSFRLTSCTSVVTRRVTPLIALDRQRIYGWWFLARLFRNQRSFASWMFCETITIVTAVALRLHHVAMAPGWLMLAMFLAAAFAIDVRGLARRRKPPEVVGLQGVEFFVVSELRAIVAFALAIAVPLATSVWLASPLPLLHVLWLSICLQVSGGAAGLFFSTLFVPRQGEIGMQFFASLTSTTVLFGLVRLAGSGLAPPGEELFWLAVTALATAGTLGVEKIRSRNYEST